MCRLHCPFLVGGVIRHLKNQQERKTKNLGIIQIDPIPSEKLQESNYSNGYVNKIDSLLENNK